MNNSTLSHNWANKIKPTGKGSSMFYEGDTIYSYGYHFPIAKFITIDENTFIAFNENGYSNSTSKHQSHVRRSIPYNYEIIKVIDMSFGFYGHENNMKHYINQINENLDKAKKATKNKEYLLNSAEIALNILNKYIRLFKIDIIGHKETLTELLNFQSIIDNYKNSPEFSAWKEKQIIKEKQRQENEIIKQAENILKFRSFEINHVYSLPHNLLRYNSDKNEIQTSGGVNMAKDIFLRYYNMFKNDTLQIGDKVQHYQFGGTKDNIVFVGCHKFELSEIENLINSIPC